jgi:hypothetical protein
MTQMSSASRSTRLSVLLLAGLLACGESSSNPGDGGPSGGDGDGGVTDGDGAVEEDELEPPPEVAPGELALRVDEARNALIVGYPEYSNLEVSFTLANGEGAPPASLSAALFQVKTSAGLYVNAEPGTAYWVKNTTFCDPTRSVGGGASFSCTLLFSLGSDEAPVELFYRTPNALAGAGDDKRSATASVTVDPCSLCGTDCTYLDSDQRHCGACDNAATFMDDSFSTVTGDCVNGKVACPEEGQTMCPAKTTDTEYQGWCSYLSSSTNNCGACGHKVVNGSCEEGAPSCYDEGRMTTCGDNYCLDINDDPRNCGGCGKSCLAVAGEESSVDCALRQEGAAPRCELTRYFSRELGSKLELGDTCEELCKNNGFGGCNNCDQFSNAVEDLADEFYCGCVWMP